MIDFPLAHIAVIAYLDPGMGSYAIQILLATLFGGMFALKQSWSVLKAWYGSTVVGRPGRVSTENTRPTIHGQSTAEIR